MLTLFVYGTLQRGQANHGYLAGQTFLGTARTLPRYRLYDAGAHPCLVRDDEEGQAVLGELWQIEDRLLPALDQLEEAPHLFERARIAVEGTAGPVVSYFYRGKLDGMADAGGAWPARSSRKA